MMKRCFLPSCLLVSSILLLPTGCREQTKSMKKTSFVPTKPNESPERSRNVTDSNKIFPKITFDRLSHDFGKVAPNSRHTSEIKFTNTGQGLLKITKLGKCCGVVAKLDKGKTKYASGEHGAVKLEWRLGPQPGAFKRQLVVHSNDTVNPVTTLNIYAKTVLRVTCEPKRLRLSPVEENAGCPKITISSLDNRPFSITEFKSTGGCVTAEFGRSASAAKHVIAPKVNMERLQKNPKGRININMTHPEGNAITIFFDVLPEYTFRPSSILIYNAEPGMLITKKIVLGNNYGKDFAIESVASKNRTVAVEVPEIVSIKNGYMFDVRITVPPRAGRTKFTDEFSVNLKSGEKLPIRCNVYYPRSVPKPQTR